MFFKRKKSEQESFGEQALEHLDALYGTALRLTGSPAGAEDLVQDTMVRALRFSHKFDPGTNLRAWLFRMMFNLFINQCRREKRGREIKTGQEQDDMLLKLLPDEHLAPTRKPEEFFFEKLFSDDVVRALDDLPLDFKMVVLLADVNGFSYKQISDVLNIPVGTVMSRLHRGRRLLRKSLYTFAVNEGYVDGRAEDPAEDGSADAAETTNLADYRARKLAGRKGER